MLRVLAFPFRYNLVVLNTLLLRQIGSELVQVLVQASGGETWQEK